MEGEHTSENIHVIARVVLLDNKVECLLVHEDSFWCSSFTTRVRINDVQISASYHIYSYKR